MFNPGSLCFYGSFVVVEWVVNRGVLNVLAHIVTWPFQAGKKSFGFDPETFSCSGNVLIMWITFESSQAYGMRYVVPSNLRCSRHGHLEWATISTPTIHVNVSNMTFTPIYLTCCFSGNCYLALENKAVNFTIAKVRLKCVGGGVRL